MKKPLIASIVLHTIFVLSFFAKETSREEPAGIEFDIIEPLAIPPPTEKVIPTNTSAKAPKAAAARSGISRDSTVENENAAATKIGNTLFKQPDNLPPGDEPLAAPADDFEVSVWPQLRNDVRIPYPREAKAKEIEGPVVMDIYVSEQGVVKKVSLVSGPGYGLNEAALKAAKDFQFSPARVGDRLVPVVIRYTYRFVIKK